MTDCHKPIGQHVVDILSPILQARSRVNNFMKELVAPSATRAHMTQLIMPQHANSLAITFGGQVYKLLDLVMQLGSELSFLGERHPVEVLCKSARLLFLLGP